MKTNSKVDKNMVVQEHCIDLPGEAVQCWVGAGSNKLRVILRKHRDIVFDINFGNGKAYTLESTDSDFYNVRDKKLIYAAQHGKVTFKDGEKIHVWVSRGFRGALLLKCDGKLISKVEPNECDRHHYSDDPKEKPAPIIIAIGAPPAPKPKVLSQPSPISKPTATSHPTKNAQIQNEEQSVHIHEVSIGDLPVELLEYIMSGGGSFHLDKYNIITRNWVFAQAASVFGYAADNQIWVDELEKCTFRLEKVVHRSGAKWYLIFKGNPRLREEMNAAKYGMSHVKILRMSGGALAGAKQAWDTVKGTAKDSLKAFAKEEGKIVFKGAGLGVFFAIGLDVAEWYNDYSEIGADGKPKKDILDLFVKIGTDLVKAGLVAGLTSLCMAGVFAGAAFIGVAAVPVALIVVGTVAVAITLTFFVEKADRKIGEALGEDDITTWIVKKFRGSAGYLFTSTKDLRYRNYPELMVY